ncbi:hypothetical protein [Algoriphagus confluentis]|uniref:Transcription factor zinc-finger domain-containing protein n=1 Tax=Algoriphagus confluentis TaxID=1697556 RepID=A0ABQ6PN53_9BACT|nr:hypothetical protein Aconfl_13480 [Algoriphagus confluentis]
MANWIVTFKDRILSWFGIGKKESQPAEPEKTPIVEVARQPGLSCPECGTKLVISIASLINYEPVLCHGCGLELTIDQEKSRQSIESLRRLQDGLDQAEKIRSDNQLN